MPKFYGKIGFGETKETSPGVWEDIITEYNYYGDVFRNTRKMLDGEGLNDNVAVSNLISVVADAYAREHFYNMQYVEWSGALWKISDVEVESPRLLLRLGGIYNGPTS